MEKMPIFAKASHHLSKAFPTCGLSSPMEKILWERSMWKHLTTMFEGGNLLNMNLTPVTNIPWKLYNFTSCATQLQSHLCQHQSDLLFHFWGNCVNLHFPTIISTIRKRVCNVCVKHKMHTKKKTDLVVPAWNLLLNCFCMVLVLSLLALLGWCNL